MTRAPCRPPATSHQINSAARSPVRRRPTYPLRNRQIQKTARRATTLRHPKGGSIFNRRKGVKIRPLLTLPTGVTERQAAGSQRALQPFVAIDVEAGRHPPGSRLPRLLRPAETAVGSVCLRRLGLAGTPSGFSCYPCLTPSRPARLRVSALRRRPLMPAGFCHGAVSWGRMVDHWAA